MIGLYLLLYLINKPLILQPAVNFGALIILVVGMVTACRTERGERKAYPFQEALKTAFIVAVVGNALYYFFYLVLFKYIDPGLNDLLREQYIRFLERFRPFFGEEQSEEMIQAAEDMPFETTLSGTFFTYAQSLIGGFILALIVATILKRKPPIPAAEA